MNRKNIIKLARVMATLDAEYNTRHFNMWAFLMHNDEWIAVDDVIADKLLSSCICGTVACAIGHLPIIFPRKARDIGARMAGESITRGWNELCEEILDIDNTTESKLWCFLFGSEWSRAYPMYHQTSWAVADRIAYILDGGEPFPSYYAAKLEKTRGLCVDKGWVAEEAWRENVTAYEAKQKELEDA